MKARSWLPWCGLLLAGPALRAAAAAPTALVFRDPARDRVIPAVLYEPAVPAVRLAVMNGGYGVPETGYTFLATALCRDGFLVVSLRHDLPVDPPLAAGGDLAARRLPAWRRGVQNLEFVLAELRRLRPALAAVRPVLIGHSNGGDIACLFAGEHPSAVDCVVTLDHRRMPVPRVAQPRFLSLRSAEFEADPGVLPDAEQRRLLGIAVVRIDGAKHMDFTDAGPPAIKDAVVRLIASFVSPPAP